MEGGRKPRMALRIDGMAKPVIRNLSKSIDVDLEAAMEVFSYIFLETTHATPNKGGSGYKGFINNVEYKFGGPVDKQNLIMVFDITSADADAKKIKNDIQDEYKKAPFPGLVQVYVSREGTTQYVSLSSVPIPVGVPEGRVFNNAMMGLSTSSAGVPGVVPSPLPPTQQSQAGAPSTGVTSSPPASIAAPIATGTNKMHKLTHISNVPCFRDVFKPKNGGDKTDGQPQLKRQKFDDDWCPVKKKRCENKCKSHGYYVCTTCAEAKIAALQGQGEVNLRDKRNAYPAFCEACKQNKKHNGGNIVTEYGCWCQARMHIKAAKERHGEMINGPLSLDQAPQHHHTGQHEDLI